MKLIVPDNNDPLLFNVIKDLITKKSRHEIWEIYWKPTKNKTMGSGRAKVFFDDLNEKETIERVLRFKEMWIEYDYALNGILPRARITENREYIIEELKRLESSPINKITVANYELVKLAEKYAPNLAVAISFFTGVDNIRNFDQRAQLPNVKEINTDVSTYRNIPLLEKLVKRGKELWTDVRVIANLGCMADCIRKEEHAIMKDMASINRENLHYAPCTFFCMKYNLEHPEEILKMPLIRPEDLERYEEIGISAVKIVDRVQKSSWIEKVVWYYLDGKYDGNILDLTCTYTRIWLEEHTNEQVNAIDIDTVIASRENVLKYRDKLPELMNVSIDHDYNFLKCNNVCNYCNWCQDISAVKYDVKRRKKVLEQLNELERKYLFK